MTTKMHIFTVPLSLPQLKGLNYSPSSTPATHSCRSYLTDLPRVDRTMLHRAALLTNVIRYATIIHMDNMVPLGVERRAPLFVLKYHTLE